MRKLLIANRGEIALRVIRTCRDLGIRVGVVHSDADASSLPVQLADRAFNLGKPYCYLEQQAIIAAAQAWGADAIHPGYGFLAENPAFAERCEAEGIAFVGPSAAGMRALGHKDQARRLARRLGVPVLPGSDGPVNDGQAAVQAAQSIGYPLLVKAVAGGGGRGMRVARNPEALARIVPAAMSEAEAAFGDGAVYIERYLPRARHVEIQVVGDGSGHSVHFGERDCSLQRRYQKLLEETPAPGLDPALRDRLAQAALAVTNAVAYRGASTIEFLVDRDSGEFFFLEANPRLQVEHPVTEMVWGIDLVALQLQLATGAALSMKQQDLSPRGAAMECRINAEDPGRQFAPSPGRLQHYRPPGGPGVRVDGAAYSGWEIPPYYDSLIAKVITWGEHRAQALERMARALGEFHISGVATTIPFHREILTHPVLRSGSVHTNFLDAEWEPASDLSPARSEPASPAPASYAPSPASSATDPDGAEIAAVAAAIAAVLTSSPPPPESRPRFRNSGDSWWRDGLRRQMDVRKWTFAPPRPPRPF